MKKWIDITVPLRGGMVHWPGDPEVEVRRLLEMEQGANCNVSGLAMTAHTGTHMDAPRHFLRGGDGIDRMPLEATIGPALVIGIRNPRVIERAELERHRIRKGERVLFRTRNSERAWWTEGFKEDFVYVTPEAAQFLAGRGVRTVGVDYLSVGGFKEGSVETHQALLRAGIWIIEGLDLSKIKPGKYELVCLPLKLMDGDGSPARAVIRPLGTNG